MWGSAFTPGLSRVCVRGDCKMLYENLCMDYMRLGHAEIWKAGKNVIECAAVAEASKLGLVYKGVGEGDLGEMLRGMSRNNFVNSLEQSYSPLIGGKLWVTLFAE